MEVLRMKKTIVIIIITAIFGMIFIGHKTYAEGIDIPNPIWVKEIEFGDFKTIDVDKNQLIFKKITKLVVRKDKYDELISNRGDSNDQNSVIGFVNLKAKSFIPDNFKYESFSVVSVKNMIIIRIGTGVRYLNNNNDDDAVAIQYKIYSFLVTPYENPEQDIPKKQEVFVPNSKPNIKTEIKAEKTDGKNNKTTIKAPNTGFDRTKINEDNLLLILFINSIILGGLIVLINKK